MRSTQVEAKINKEEIKKQLENAAGGLQELIQEYGEEKVCQQLELEEYSKKLGEHLLLQSIEKRKGNSYENRLGEMKRTGGKDLKSFCLTNNLVEYSADEVTQGIMELVNEATVPKRGVKPGYYSLLAEIVNTYQGGCKKGDDCIAKVSEMIAVCSMSVMLEEIMATEAGEIENNMALCLATELEEEVKAEKLFSSLPKTKVKSVTTGLSKRVGMHFRTYFISHCMSEYSLPWAPWSKDNAVALGLAIIDIVTSRCSYFERVQPASPSNVNTSMQMEIHASDTLLEGWKRNIDNMVSRAHRLCPCVIPPKKWTALKSGGYYGTLAGRVDFMRQFPLYKTTKIYKDYASRLEQSNIDNVFAAINAIQETPWQINREVLEVLQYNNRNDKGWGDTPHMEPEPKIPELVGDYTDEELKEHKKVLVEYYHRENSRISKAMRLKDIEYAAAEYSQYETIYFPHNIDFRGRVYPVCCNISPQGDDVAKSLVKFADAPALESEEAAKYLLIQGANVAGIDKVSLDDRIKWVEDNKDNILEAARKPTESDWWQQQDKPWQFLAFCFEYHRMEKYKESHGGSVIGYVAEIPFAQDGSCSGIQHYSAASRDAEGGRQVNLLPGEKPNDIYGVYAEKVIKQLQRDLLEGTPDEETTKEDEETGETISRMKLGTKTLAQGWMSYGITRKVTKRPVMTLPYGATAGGYKQQILEDTIEPAIEHGKGEMFRGFKMQYAVYLAKIIYEEVAGLNAVKYMDWLRKVTELITKNSNVVTWVTPLGLPLQQNYMEVRSEKMQLRVNGVRRWAYINSTNGNIDKKAQKQGTPPNFIHSMDACHLQMTVLAAYSKGIRHFAMIHDSYGAPAAQAQIMWDTVREQFVAMYSENDVFTEFRENAIHYVKSDDEIPELPPKGNLDLNCIKDSLYAFC